MRSLPQRFFLKDNLDIIIETDASDYGIGAVMYQIQKDPETGIINKLPIEFISKSLTPQQYRWNTTEKECYAIVFALKKWQEILIDKPFTLRSDHENLQYINDSGSSKVLRWKLFLLEFDFDIEHIAGEDNVVADSLSRCVNIIVPSPSFETLDMFSTWTKDLSEKQHIVTGIILAIRQSNLIDNKLREAFKLIHNDIEGHLQVRACMKKLNDLQLGRIGVLKPQIRQLILECDTCQRLNRAKIQANTEPFVINTTYLMQKICMDTNGPFPEDKYGYNYILVITDSFSRWTEMYPLKTASAEEAVGKVIDFCARFQVPSHILTDNGKQFMNEFFDCLYKLSGIERMKTIPYSSKQNGLVERLNKEINRHLEAFCIHGDNRDSWSDYIPFIRRILNGSYHSSIGTTPASMIYGDRIDMDWVYAPRELRNEELQGKGLNEYIKTSQEMQDEVIAKAALWQDALNDRNISNRRLKRINIPFQSFQLNDWVLMENRNNTHGLMKRAKLDTARLGPFKVIEIIGDDSYRIQAPNDKRSRIVRVDQLTPYIYDKATVDPEEIAISNSKDLFIIEAIEAYRPKIRSKKELEFKIRWKDYPDEQDKTWANFKDINFNGTNIVFQEWIRDIINHDSDHRLQQYVLE